MAIDYRKKLEDAEFSLKKVQQGKAKWKKQARANKAELKDAYATIRLLKGQVRDLEAENEESRAKGDTKEDGFIQLVWRKEVRGGD